MATEDIKKEIPRLFYEGLWMSMNILIHEHLRSKDGKRKKAACSEFLNKLTDSNFIKNLALLKDEGESEKEKAKKPVSKPKVDWGK